MAEVESIIHEGWGELVLNRPEVRNAINGPFGQALAAEVRALDANVDVKVILLRGAQGAFCSGLDLKAFNAEPAPEWMSGWGTTWRDAHKALYTCGKPIVAALEKYAINGGAALALAADLLVAGETAFLHVGEVQQGMAAPYNMAWLRLRHSEALAARVAIVGRRMLGPELKSVGIAYEVAPDLEVVACARQLVESLAAYPNDALARIKKTLRAYNDVPADAWFDRATGAVSGPRRAPARNPA